MEKPKPTQNHEQERPKTLEDYVVATFHADADPDITTSPLTVIRSGQDGKGVRHDGGLDCWRYAKCVILIIVLVKCAVVNIL